MEHRKFVATSVVSCPACYGNGYVQIVSFDDVRRERCQHCNGTGKVQEYAEITSLGDAANE